MTSIQQLTKTVSAAVENFAAARTTGHKPGSEEFRKAQSRMDRAKAALRRAQNGSGTNGKATAVPKQKRKSARLTLSIGDEAVGMIDSVGAKGFGFVQVTNGPRLFFTFANSKVKPTWKLRRGVDVKIRVGENRKGFTAIILSLAEEANVPAPEPTLSLGEIVEKMAIAPSSTKKTTEPKQGKDKSNSEAKKPASKPRCKKSATESSNGHVAFSVPVETSEPKAAEEPQPAPKLGAFHEVTVHQLNGLKGSVVAASKMPDEVFGRRARNLIKKLQLAWYAPGELGKRTRELHKWLNEQIAARVATRPENESNPNAAGQLLAHLPKVPQSRLGDSPEVYFSCEKPRGSDFPGIVPGVVSALMEGQRFVI